MEALFATIVTTGLVGAFLFYLTPKTASSAQLEILQPREISPAFDEALGTALFWKFKGGFGRYLRSATIPALSARARSQRLEISIIGQILDPRDKGLCGKHAELRNSVTTVEGKNDWTVDSVRTELYSTVLVALIEATRTANLDIKIYLLNHFSPTRIDLSSDVGILTREDRIAPAIRVKNGTYFYDSYNYEFGVVRRQGFEVQQTSLACDFDMLEPPTAEELLKDVLLWDEDIRPILQAICTTVNEKNNPYG